MPTRFPPPPPLPKKAGLFRQVPPAIFPPLLGLLGLGLSWRRGAAAFGIPPQAVELALGAISLLFAFGFFAYVAKLMLRSEVYGEDLKTLPGRTGLAAMSMGLMLLGAVLVPYMEVTATLLLAMGFVWHLITALKVALQFVTARETAGPVTAALQLVFVGFIVAPAAALPLGVPASTIAILTWYCLFAALAIAGLTLAPLLTGKGTPPLRPLHAIHLAPAALVATAAFSVGLDTLALVALVGATTLFALLVLRARWMTEGGFSGFWSAFTFPAAAFAGAWLAAYETLGLDAARIAGGLALVFATMIIPPIALRVMQMWAKGTLAAKTNPAIA